jgi:hypothetical protein
MRKYDFPLRAGIAIEFPAAAAVVPSKKCGKLPTTTVTVLAVLIVPPLWLSFESLLDFVYRISSDGLLYSRTIILCLVRKNSWFK